MTGAGTPGPRPEASFGVAEKLKMVKSDGKVSGRE